MFLKYFDDPLLFIDRGDWRRPRCESRASKMVYANAPRVFDKAAYEGLVPKVVQKKLRFMFTGTHTKECVLKCTLRDFSRPECRLSDFPWTP
ncbi:hypothetical protein MMRN_51840 [Mycobacterium marinum]|nr:hypothetical protein CCUG20998_04806 [Mycobacterium marinum]RFZ22939.1 hypothetical protein DSM44344_03386 [Mycobacterium marinum]RFZ24706.1 hypothetical protein DSM43519_02105 [Mycobacterium marinum]RFZ31211.1 hypothetical protein NCTC2275_03583 [Mycobacterium marinum]BBC68288.1 hypothetical protein MMRN_51840 [Mycobacterium marinum]